MSKMKWFISLILSLGLLAGCEETAVKPEKKAEPKQEEQKEVAKQEEQKDIPKPEEKQAEPEQKPQEEQKDKQEQKVEEKQKEEKAQEQPEVKKEEQPAANKQPEQKVQEEKPQPPKAPEAKEEAKVVNQPKETPKQEQKEDPNKGQKVTVPVPPTPVPDPVPSVPDPVIPKPKQVTISVKGNEGYLLGAKKIDVQEGDTVYSVLKSTGLDVDAMGSKGDVYVKGIENLYEKDVNDNSGWKYRVNGSFPNRSAGVVTVKPGDTVEWVYVY
ncbi:DUF4430 domain-containing protein [Bacillus sp. R86525]|uniref:DUF4430 domain-containing protein n=1 Tax=Bacillus sp. R86525 TaxID=3101709 RepID=UPI00366E1A94